MADVSERVIDDIETMRGPEILGSIDQIKKLDKVAWRTFRLDDVRSNGFTPNFLSISGDMGVWKSRIAGASPLRLQWVPFVRRAVICNQAMQSPGRNRG